MSGRRKGKDKAFSSDDNTLKDMFGILEKMTEVLQRQVEINNVPGNRGLAPPVENQVSLEKFMNQRPPPYMGELDATLAERWLMRIEKIFKALGCDDENKVTFATYMLHGDTEHWWNMVELEWKDDHIPRTWEMFLLAFNEKYILEDEKDRREVEFVNLQQGNLTISEYEARFIQLSRYAPELVHDEQKKRKKFFNGLRMEFKERIEPLHLQTFTDTVARAREMENRDKERRLQLAQTNSTRPGPSHWQSGKNYSKNNKVPRTGNNQWQGGSQQRQSDSKSSAQGSQLNRKACAHCNKENHIT